MFIRDKTRLLSICKKRFLVIGILFLVIIIQGGQMRILITGASSGIGYQVGKILASHGHLVYMTCHTVKEVFHLREKLERDGVSAICFKIDLLTDDIDIVDHLDIDCLFNHAGVGCSGSILTMNEECLRDVFEVNFFRSFLLLKKTYHHMVEKKISGKIFVTSSLLGMFPIPFFGVYSSSKSAISQLVKTLQKEEEVFCHSISFCLVEPGAYATGFNQMMIDRGEKYVEDFFYKKYLSIRSFQRKLFLLLESSNINGISKRIVKEIEHKKTKNILRIPWIQGFILKIYHLFFS